MKFREIFRYELTYQLSRLSTWLLLGVFLIFGFWILRMVTLTDGTYLNAPGTITFFTVFGSAIWLVTGGVVAGEAATRDVQTRMHPLTYTTPVSKRSYLGGRFLAALALNVLILLMLYAGFLLSLYGPGAKTQFLGPFRLDSYLSNFGFVALPTVIAVTAIQFTCAALSRRAIASYIASMLIIIFSQFGGTTVTYKLEWKAIGSLMDLLGTSIVAAMEGWTPIDKNTRLVLLEGTWLWNRLLWFGIAAGALMFTYFRFRLAHVLEQVSWFRFFRRLPEPLRHTAAAALQPSPAVWHDTSPIRVPNIARKFVFHTHVRQAFALAAASFRTIAGSRAGLTLVALLAIGTGLFATEYMEFYGVPLFARAQEVLNVLTPSLSSFKTQWIIIPLLTIFYAGELVWRERETGVHSLTDTSPVPEAFMFLGKFMGLALIITTWVAFLMMAGIINQLVMGYHHFEIGVYIKALFGIQLTNYLLFALLVFALHVVVNQKYIGHILAIGIYGFIMFASMIGVEHKLLVYASDPGWSYSDMRGFKPFVKPWAWFKFYWASWAFLLAMVAILFWVRSKEGGLKTRFQLARYRLRRHKVALLTAVVLVVIAGGFIFYNTNVLNRYVNTGDRVEMRAEYQRLYGQYENTVQPALARTNLLVELYTTEGRADIQATYLLVNRSKVAIDSIHISTIPQLQLTGLQFDRGVTPAIIDEELGYRIYALKEGLQSGDSLQLRFAFHINPRGFSNDGVDASIVANGSHLTSDWMPIIGFHEDRRLRGAVERLKHGLPPRPERPYLYDVSARNDARHAEPMDFEAVVGTSRDQIAVAPGALRRKWIEGDRQYFHYATNVPISHDYALFSARYALREARWVPHSPPVGQAHTDLATGPAEGVKPVTIQIFYHPEHNANIERMLKSAQASLQYYTQVFGPYPYSHFRVLERPGHGRGMHAEAMTIDYQEGYSLMNPDPEGLDLPYHIMAHEVAHQWWGFQLAPAAVEGSGLLVESFATYSAMQVVEENLGYEHLLRYLAQMRQEYEVPRSRAMPPLLRANNRFMNYRKGPFALFALRHYIGKDRVNSALRRMLQNYTTEPPLPTTLDLYKELQAVTPDSLYYLVHDLFAANTYWELKTEQASAKQTKAGSWQLRLEVDARKLTVDSMGVATDIPMHDWIEIGVYGARAAGESQAKVLYLQKHRIHSGRQTILLQVAEQPSRAGIDPRHLLIDLKMDDNSIKIK
ncbi:putative membrane protein [Flammeovirgaceae bacterium 311]|nr:putative membrane protein [Flammeovirgaceae bacterium 311]